MSERLTLHHGDCLSVLRNLPDCSVDSVVTDPPYGLSFMGKRWDYDVPSIEVWAECLRVLKPGGHRLFRGLPGGPCGKAHELVENHARQLTCLKSRFKVDTCRWRYKNGETAWLCGSLPDSPDRSRCVKGILSSFRWLTTNSPFNLRNLVFRQKPSSEKSERTGCTGKPIGVVPEEMKCGENIRLCAGTRRCDLAEFQSSGGPGTGRASARTGSKSEHI